uniref:Family with sequence similarity 151 member B n=1 Tax=Seriola lalandi dorsalis TaxID=1841481 RepID=A0A3B4XM96_SERLL
MSDRTLEYFLSLNQITKKDASEVKWSHAVNSRSRLTEALTGPMHMLEADIIIRGRDPKEPVMAHPPDTDSDITLKEWLEAVKAHDKGIKLDFKSLISQSLSTIESPKSLYYQVETLISNCEKAARMLICFLFFSSGYSWDTVRVMEEICRTLEHPVTFPVRAALLSQSFSQLKWLLQQSDR